MLGGALKHYVLVGLIWPFAGGWALTFVVNTTIGLAIESYGVVLGDQYWWALVTTCSSLTLVGFLAVIGNRLYRRTFGAGSLSRWALAISTILFMATVLPWIWPPLSETVAFLESHVRYVYRNSGEAGKMLSLPLLRWCVLPASYVLAGRALLPPALDQHVQPIANDTQGA